jgi:hypothetical protein
MMIGEVPLCVDCEYKYQQSRYLVFVQSAAMMNHAASEIDAIAPFGPPSPKIQIPPAPVPPIHYNNQSVSVSGGTVGSINFGQVETIKVDIDALTQSGAVTQAEALVAVVNAVLDEPSLPAEKKNELLEQLAFLTKEAALPAAERKPSVIKSVLNAIKDGASTAGAIATAWQTAGPIVRGYFGL